MKTVVLLSGGLDSVTNLYLAREQSEVIKTVTFNYGQRAAKKEIDSAQFFSNLFKIPHEIVDLSGLFRTFGKSSLVDTNKEVPQGQEVLIDNLEQSKKTASSVWVPNRNGIFLNIAAGFAEALGADAVVPGFNIEEATTFPDNTEAFLQALSHSFSYSTASGVKALCFTTSKNKTEIVALGKARALAFSHLWPCYFSEEHWCGQCESCQRFQRALNQNGIKLDSLN